jgi:uncharacterized membrane protein YebE (DUF533 family)
MKLLRIKQKKCHLTSERPANKLYVPAEHGTQVAAPDKWTAVLTSQTCKKFSKIQMLLQFLVAISSLAYQLWQNRFLECIFGTSPQQLRLKTIKAKQQSF